MASSFIQMARTLSASAPTSPDGEYAKEANPVVGGTEKHVGLTADFLGQIRKGKLLSDTRTIIQGISTVSQGEPVDDRQLLLEHGVGLLQGLEPGSKVGEKLSDAFISLLWNDLPHPPCTQIGPQARYRSADGSNNNIWNPGMGKAGSPYCRNVPARAPKPTNLPDPGLVYDSLLKREKFVPHPTGFSSLFFAFATIVIHECFQTNKDNNWINDTSSYVDLSTLYGNNVEDQKQVRTFSGAGTIWPDVIGNYRIMMMPPTVNAVLVCFSRNHNVIADTIFKVNESGKYKTDLESLTDDEKAWQDEDIFQISRNVNIAFFASVVLRDYVNAILNTTTSGSSWNLDLGKEIKDSTGKRLDRATGGGVSIEFNTLYRWHAALSQKDSDWFENLLKSQFPHKPPSEVTPAEFYRAGFAAEKALMDRPPKEWEIYGLKRGSDGKYDDNALADLLKDAIEEPAGAFKARGSPEAFKVIEILGQLQARQYGVCTMNEFRRYLNLKPFDTFLEWNSDPEIAKIAEALYVHPDNLELYPGLMAEEAKPSMSGSGVAVGHTIARGILDDAVSLVRADRFLTYDLSTYTLTSAGMEMLSPHNGAQGGILSKVLFNALPRAFTFNSVYALFPFFTPNKMKTVLKDLGRIGDYDVERKPSLPDIQGVNSYEGVKGIFEDTVTFPNVYEHNLKLISNGRGFLIGWDNKEKHEHDKDYMLKCLFPEGFEAPMRDWFRDNTNETIRQKSVNLTNDKVRHLDICRDVANVVPIVYIAEKWGLPLKTEETPHGLFTVYELHLMLVVLFVFTSFDVIPANGWDLRAGALQSATVINEILKGHFSFIGSVMDSIFGLAKRASMIFSKQAKSAYALSPEASALFKALQATGEDHASLVTNCLGSMIPIAGNLTQQFVLLVDLYLDPKHEYHKNRIVQLSHSDSPAADNELLGYVWEGMRLNPVVVGVPRTTSKDVTVKDGEREVFVKKDGLILVSTSNANMDPTVFPDPEKIDPNRPRDKYMLLGHGMRYCLGAKLVGIPLREMLRSTFKLKNLRRAPGAAGTLSRIPIDIAGSTFHVSLDINSSQSPFPSTLSVLYDDE